MARKHQLREQRAGTVINVTSKKQESEIIQALSGVVDYLANKYGSRINLIHAKQWLLKDIVAELRHTYPEVSFHYHFDNSSIRPDGGVLFIQGADTDELTYPILISEVKNQGTNDLRVKEGLPKQAKGNAIERLGKNLIGLRTALIRESIFPFVCFGYGCDFAANSSIRDRVSTMAMFGELNKTHLHVEESGRFNRGSFYFREARWSVGEMQEVMKDIAERSVLYYFSKYREEHFQVD
ncbi:EcoRI family type II restriction endonuclease [Aeoliella mucimassa]|uniref:Type-2 restriction enzyme RsrI n=1 Tax=Aeoliella mucimassa TaxID=2527972 RepID=A0A518AMK6_9BACT|nr:EcoRI family type II restriction endonuclease [Aeoliella mucimassa]QDU55965.1 Type-2 restriction enzyme RsrI [Aeoliella mucimassa]